jgi:hypothetical protein
MSDTDVLDGRRVEPDRCADVHVVSVASRSSPRESPM